MSVAWSAEKCAWYYAVSEDVRGCDVTESLLESIDCSDRSDESSEDEAVPQAAKAVRGGHGRGSRPWQGTRCNTWQGAEVHRVCAVRGMEGCPAAADTLHCLV